MMMWSDYLDYKVMSDEDKKLRNEGKETGFVNMKQRGSRLKK